MSPQYAFNYKTESSESHCLGFEEESCRWPRAKMIGGCGASNGMIYLRGNKGDFDKWENGGISGWGWNDVVPYFEKSTNFVNETGLHLNHFQYTHPSSKLFIEAAKETGKPFIDNYLDVDREGYTLVWGTQKDGRRMSTGKSFLAAAKDRPNLHVIKHAFVEKVNFNCDGVTAESVTFIYNNEHKFTVKANKEIILSAGAIDSPKILMLSGVGPSDHLEEFKINLIKDLPVGHNLQDHFSVLMFFKVDKSAFEISDPLDDLYSYLRNSSGPLSGNGPLSLVGLVNTDPTNKYPSIGFYHVPHDTMQDSVKQHGFKPELFEDQMDADENHRVLKVLVCLMRPESLGKVELRSNSYQDSPKIYANYLDENYDLEQTLQGVKYQKSLMETNTFKKYNGQFMKPKILECDEFSLESDEYWSCYIKYMGTTIYHPMGTNKMGSKTDESAVVDERLRVKDLNGLRVADASIMPHMVSSNINSAVIMVGEKASEMIIEDWS